MSSGVGILVQRARRAEAHGDTFFADALWRRVVRALDADSPEARGLLHEALDFVQLQFGSKSEEAEWVADRLAELFPDDARSYHILGLRRSMEARRRKRADDLDGAVELAQEAEGLLQQSLDLDAGNADVWGVLGGVRKRIADWTDDPESKAQYGRAAIEAYRKGAEAYPDPYCVLNYIEERAIADPESPMLPRQEDIDLLDRALRLRKRQFDCGHDEPWPAFDLARGYFYRSQDEASFRADIRIAIGRARKVARSADDRHALHTTLYTLRRLHEARPSLPLGLAIDILRDALDEPWLLEDDLRPIEASAPLDEVSNRVRELQAQLRHAQGSTLEALRTLVEGQESLLSEAEEKRFEKEVAEFKDEIRTTDVKVIKFVWKTMGKTALKSLLGVIPGLSAVPGFVGAVVDAIPSEGSSPGMAGLRASRVKRTRVNCG